MRKEQSKIYFHQNNIEKCPMCRVKLSIHDKRCPCCGTDLKEFNEAYRKNKYKKQELTQKRGETQIEQHSQKENHILPIIAIIVVLLFAIGIGFISDTKNSEATAQHHIINYF